MKVKGLFIVLICLAACDRVSPVSEEPHIEYISVSPNLIKESTNIDSLETQIKFSFEDGDGDLGSPSDTNVFNLFIKDNRPEYANNPNAISSQTIPFLPSNPKNPLQKGDITVKYIPFFAPNVSKDTTSLTLYIYDRAGHKSNEVVTDSIFLQR